MNSVWRWAAIGAATAVAMAGAGPGSEPESNVYDYAGRLLEEGLPVNGRLDFEFRVFTAPIDGAHVGPVLIAEDLPVEDGSFLVTLDFGAFALDERAHWLEVSVEGQTLLPRRALLDTFELSPHEIGAEATRGDEESAAAEPNARRVGTAHHRPNHGVASIASVGSAHPTGDAPEDPGENPLTAEENDDSGGGEDGSNGVWNTRGNEYYYKRANVGVGTSNPAYPLDVRNNSRSRTLNVDNTDNAGTRYGIYARAKSTSGRGVYGYASASSGSTIGVYGRSNSDDGIGVYGFAPAADNGSTGVCGQSNGGTGVCGLANGSGGQVFGLRGTASGNGVGSRMGVNGFAQASGSINYGVIGFASNGTQNYGVFGNGGNNTWAGWFQGNANVSGTLSKGGGAFRIDHPLDPENKYLLHSFVESPDMMNIYNGNVVTDADGYATITMPEWFDALNRDFRYQLTVIDGADEEAFVMAKVTAEMEGGQFTIRTSAGWTKVSWQVTGIRQDPFANANRIPVEEDKPEHERGAYLHPEAWGQPDAPQIGAVELPTADSAEQ